MPASPHGALALTEREDKLLLELVCFDDRPRTAEQLTEIDLNVLNVLRAKLVLRHYEVRGIEMEDAHLALAQIVAAAERLAVRFRFRFVDPHYELTVGAKKMRSPSLRTLLGEMAARADRGPSA